MTERPTPARRSHPLLGAFPLAVMAVATFLVVFTLMMARLSAGADPALQASAARTALVRGAGAATIVTRASGTAAGTAQQASATPGATTATPAVATRTSGAGAGRLGDD